MSRHKQPYTDNEKSVKFSAGDGREQAASILASVPTFPTPGPPSVAVSTNGNLASLASSNDLPVCVRFAWLLRTPSLTHFL